MLTFDAVKHLYRWNGNPVPSVTQILGDNGHISDFCKSKTHAKKGTDIHEMVSMSINGSPGDEIRETFSQYDAQYQQWLEFLDETGFEVIASELAVYGYIAYYEPAPVDAPDWAGTMDLYGIFPKSGDCAVVDMKTGSTAPPHTKLQTALYSMGYSPLDYTQNKRYSLRLDGKKKYKLKPYEDPEDYRIAIEEVKKWQRNQALNQPPW